MTKKFYSFLEAMTQKRQDMKFAKKQAFIKMTENIFTTLNCPE